VRRGARSILDTANASSAARLPNAVRGMLGSLRLLVNQRFGPDVANTAIGAVLFLRFICPAIAAPDAFQVVDGQLSKDDRRACVLVSKVIQNLANGVRFGQKEEFMEPMNAFIDRQTPAYNAFIQEIATRPRVR
jgi:neurofibromin 1